MRHMDTVRGILGDWRTILLGDREPARSPSPPSTDPSPRGPRTVTILSPRWSQYLSLESLITRIQLHQIEGSRPSRAVRRRYRYWASEAAVEIFVGRNPALIDCWSRADTDLPHRVVILLLLLWWDNRLHDSVFSSGKQYCPLDSWIGILDPDTLTGESTVQEAVRLGLVRVEHHSNPGHPQSYTALLMPAGIARLEAMAGWGMSASSPRDV